MNIIIYIVIHCSISVFCCSSTTGIVRLSVVWDICADVAVRTDL